MKMTVFAIVLILYIALLFVTWAVPGLNAALGDGTGLELKHLLLALFLVIGITGSVTYIVNPEGAWRSGIWSWFFRESAPSRKVLLFIRAAGVFLLLAVVVVVILLV